MPDKIVKRKVKEVQSEYGKNLYPNELTGWFFPNWFNKEHFEEFGDVKMTDEQFEEFKKFLVDETSIHDEISTTMGEFVREFWEDFEKSEE